MTLRFVAVATASSPTGSSTAQTRGTGRADGDVAPSFYPVFEFVSCVLAAKIRDRAPGLVFLQNPDDLLTREAAAFHVPVLSLSQNALQTGLSQRGSVITHERKDLGADWLAGKNGIQSGPQTIDAAIGKQSGMDTGMPVGYFTKILHSPALHIQIDLDAKIFMRLSAVV